MTWWGVDIGIGSQEFSYTVRADRVVEALAEACRLGALDIGLVQYVHISQLGGAPVPAWPGRRTRARRPE